MEKELEQQTETREPQLFTSAYAQDAFAARLSWLSQHARGPRVLDVGSRPEVVTGLATPTRNVVRVRASDEALARLETEHVETLDAHVSAVGDELGRFDTVVLADALLDTDDARALVASVTCLCQDDATLLALVPFGTSQSSTTAYYFSQLLGALAPHFRPTELFVRDGYLHCRAVRDVSGEYQVDYEALLRETESQLRTHEQRARESAIEAEGSLRAAEKAVARAKAERHAANARVVALLKRLRGPHTALVKADKKPSAAARAFRKLLARRDKSRRLRKMWRTAVITEAQQKLGGDARLVHRPSRTKLPVKIACILDEFSWENLRHECDLMRLPQKGWKEFLEREAPDFVLVESAWNGNDGDWIYRITYDVPRADNPLFAMLAYCRQKQIPTVFWNKEDPPNYDRFIDAARRFDVVFTTDEKCIPRYHQDAPGVRVEVLPFAAQQSVQNPVNRDAFETLGDVCFAGAWYARHPERHEDAKNLIDAAKSRKLHIYDRYLHHPQHEKYKFPDEYEQYIAGSLTFDEMLVKYRQYRAYLNVNSVKDSPTMFSRRVLELLACGTPVVSGYALGIEKLLGPDVVPLCKTSGEAKIALNRILDEPFYRDELVLKGQRRVFKEHTYRHRIRQVCAAVGIELPSAEPRVSCITATRRLSWLEPLLKNFQRQEYPDKELFVVVNEGDELTPEHVRAGAESLGIENVYTIVAPRSATLGACLNLGIEQSSGSVWAKMDDDDYYGAHYLTDSVLALDYSGAACVGKASFFTYAQGRDQTFIHTGGRSHRMMPFVIGPTLVAKKRIFPEVQFADLSVGEDTAFIEQLLEKGHQLYSHSPYNYVKFYGRRDHHTWKVDEAEYLKNAKPVFAGDQPDRVCF